MKSFANGATILGAVMIALGLVGCASPTHMNSTSITRESFGSTDGKAVELFTLRNAHGMEVKISNYGGIITSLLVPNQQGKLGDVVLGYDNLDGYLKSTPYFGALIGRYGNRIAHGKFTLNGKEYTLATNNYPNALHGGIKGFDKVVWDAKVVLSGEGPALELTYLSKDGEEGYPGNLKVLAVYKLGEDNTLRLDFTATTDADTPINLTQHTYFNLAGKGDILDTVITIYADKFTPVDATLIPTGELRPVKGTPFDFTKPTTIGARIKNDDEQLKFGLGYDHNWVLNKSEPGKLTLAAAAFESTSGRVLELWTTEPGLQFYTGNFLDGSITGKNGWTYQYRNAFCMEPQHFPDSPNHPNFPSVILKPGQTHKNTIVYKFSSR
jgi:aldose 1-epimerase